MASVVHRGVWKGGGGREPVPAVLQQQLVRRAVQSSDAGGGVGPAATNAVRVRQCRGPTCTGSGVIIITSSDANLMLLYLNLTPSRDVQDAKSLR